MKSLLFVLRMMAVGMVMFVLGCSGGEVPDCSGRASRQTSCGPSPSPTPSPVSSPTPTPNPSPTPASSKRYTIYYHWNNTSNINLRCIGNDLDENNFAIADVGAIFPNHPVVTGASLTTGFFQATPSTNIRLDIKDASGNMLASEERKLVNVGEDKVTNVHITFDGTKMTIDIHEPKADVD